MVDYKWKGISESEAREWINGSKWRLTPNSDKVLSEAPLSSRRKGHFKGVINGFLDHAPRNVFGIDLPYTAFNQYLMPIFKTVSLTELRTGDLVFFSPTAKKKKVNHVGIYLSNGDFAHAIQKRGVTVSNFENRYWKSRIISTKRIVKGKIKNENDSRNLCQPSIEDLGCFFFPFDG